MLALLYPYQSSLRSLAHHNFQGPSPQPQSPHLPPDSSVTVEPQLARLEDRACANICLTAGLQSLREDRPELLVGCAVSQRYL